MLSTVMTRNGVNIAVSLGGTKVAVGLVDVHGEIHHRKEVDWRQAFGLSHDSRDRADRLVRGIVDLIWEAFQEAQNENWQVVKIGLSVKGPLKKKDDNGDLQLTWLQGPFNNFPIVTRLVEELRDRRPSGYTVEIVPVRETSARESRIEPNCAVARIEIQVLHDGAAAILGEVSLGGTFSGEPDAVVVIIGTGVGLGVVEKGELYEGNDDRPDERVFGSLGRHLVYVPDASAIGYHYEYRGIAAGEKRADINSAIGETYFSVRVAGPGLAERIARELLGQSRATVWEMKLHDVERHRLERFSRRTNRDDDTDLEKRILEGLTQAALKQNPWAREKIAEIGIEIGRALGEFILTFRHRHFVKQIVLVSTVAEKLGKGVSGNSSNDLLLEYVRDGIERTLHNHLHRDNLSDREKARLTHIIRNSVIKRSDIPDRELLAFAPSNSTQSSIERTFSVNHLLAP